MDLAHDIFLKLIERIRRTIPGVAIRTSMIVGFPGETAQDFEELCRFVEAARFDRLGVFSYSDEDTSASYHLDGKVDARTIYNRKRRLMALQRKIAQARNRQLIGTETSILVEGLSKETDLLWEGRMPTQAPEIDGVTLINDFGRRAGRAKCAACASPKLTITIWSTLLASDTRAYRQASGSTGAAKPAPTPNPHPRFMTCPICRKKITRENPEYPFCSERCRTIDLGNWASGKYVISSPLSPQSPSPQRSEEQDED